MNTQLIVVGREVERLAQNPDVCSQDQNSDQPCLLTWLFQEPTSLSEDPTTTASPVVVVVTLTTVRVIKNINVDSDDFF